MPKLLTRDLATGRVTEVDVETSSGGGGAAPTFVPGGATSTVALHTQQMWNASIEVDGVLIVDGVLAQVA